jgi:GT2 family glycosyltransferase
MLDLDIGVIYTYESGLMNRLIESMRASGDELRMRLILVDNNSKQGVDSWAKQFGETKIVYNKERLTYAQNVNRVLAASSARYILLMNTDMFFDPFQQCLAKMVAFMDANPRCGVSGCRLYYANGTDARPARRFQTLRTILARRCHMAGLFSGSLDRYFYSERSPDETWQCDWLSGCFLMVRREAHEQVGGFDEGFGKYFEDVDFCLRMARAGWLVMYHGNASCFHLERRASKKLLSADAWEHFCSYLLFLRKWGFRPGRMIADAPLAAKP